MHSDITFWSALAGAFVGAIVSAYFSYRAGKQSAEDQFDREIDQRMRNVEQGMTELQTLVRFYRRDRRKRNRPNISQHDASEIADE